MTEWIRRRDMCDVRQKLSKEMLEPEQIEYIIETKKLRSQKPRDQRLNRNVAEGRKIEQTFTRKQKNENYE